MRLHPAARIGTVQIGQQIAGGDVRLRHEVVDRVARHDVSGGVQPEPGRLRDVLEEDFWLPEVSHRRRFVPGVPRLAAALDAEALLQTLAVLGSPVAERTQRIARGERSVVAVRTEPHRGAVRTVARGQFAPRHRRANPLLVYRLGHCFRMHCKHAVGPCRNACGDADCDVAKRRAGVHRRQISPANGSGPTSRMIGKANVVRRLVAQADARPGALRCAARGALRAADGRYAWKGDEAVEGVFGKVRDRLDVQAGFLQQAAERRGSIDVLPLLGRDEHQSAAGGQEVQCPLEKEKIEVEASLSGAKGLPVARFFRLVQLPDGHVRRIRDKAVVVQMQGERTSQNESRLW